ncbi:hypothetical protein ACFL3C_02175 [Patescibacteria group bacterium]
MQKNCKNCGSQFTIEDEDLKFYDKISPTFDGKKFQIPPPTHCSDCRQQRRLAWRNERTLYRRKCDATGKNVVSVFSSDKPLKVYNNDYWYSDKWDPLEYGMDFDFNRPFFEQFHELIEQVPQVARSAVRNQNSDYVNQCGWCKNCYLIFEADYNENCMYGNNVYDSRSSMDFLHIFGCELCYECVNCTNCYNLKFSQNCQNCSDSYFLKNCIGCKNCFGSINLRNKEFYFLNEKCTKEEYEQRLKSISLGEFSTLNKLKEKFTEHTSAFPNKYMEGTQNEDSTGDYLNNTQRCKDCYDLVNCQDCKYVFNSRNVKNVYDMTVFGSKHGVEFCYENHEIGDGVRNVCFSDQAWSGIYDIYYSKLCMNNSHDLFGCVGLKHAKYCILNKQYSEEEYEKLASKIVEHMIKTGEWGEFLPASMSPFAYNETIAQDYYPLKKEEALQKGYRWKEPDQKEYQPKTYVIPDDIKEVPDSIMNEILACSDCGKNYKIIQQEYDFYQKFNLPISRKCPDCRHKDRMKLRNLRKLHNGNCDKCNADIQTTYSPDHSEKVYCERCYLESVV